MSKGSERRPARVTTKEFESNWEQAFHVHACEKDDAGPMACLIHYCRCACGAWQLQSGLWIEREA